MRNKSFTVSGWGNLAERGGVPSVLHSVVVRGMSNRQCSKFYPGYIEENMLCAGHTPGGIDACEGDSGGKQGNNYPGLNF